MKKIILLSALLLFASTAFAVPQYINYQGYLKSPTGEALSGTYTMQFVVYDNPTGGAAVFDSGAQSVAVSNGLYTVKLGTVDSNDFNGDDRWLEVSVGVETLSPRLQIYSAAYALRADAATNTGYATVSGTATTSASADYATVAGTATSAASATTATTANIASYAILAGSASSAAVSYAPVAGTATTSAYAIISGTATTSAYATNTGYATVSGTATTSASADYATVAGTATSAATADYAPLAGSATTAASADYATLTGTATNATTVNHINASTTATANYLYPLDSGGKLAGVPVSAEASSGFALFIDGKLGASSSVVGSDTIAAGDSDKVVSNTAVSANSAVFVMLGPKDYDMGAIWITDISAGSFTVKTTNWAPVGGMPFRYLIIN
ncbi:hypothetical protein A2291_04970 [candidate division WOR-1 bacterium RIFOXYB2_FULL_42_35]|uniref:Uncharacterized protein n=1 Tax=candidate division WOR-1 bacterium RIFOXYC2_FULL_41_25 TaxID=1802586 RepID=A0A1F4TNE4_UNCSA|nr:MAG: hypothetical protein A2247_07170 [candidate division WOR-1 bacterium RIFOXYA2_FULL_41_14]OGC24681.1 MAG: hypothetical protein A2291_04970 [candidate division WOR-1 bacterium RIFOXYB2_FULL_42_35]OGC34196.1 MAG: hypothetical protein A2462_08215 [candidate division WOR-1 bacterium RIFOXYC2_FULL_41_25]OGC41398.1 MAG: hypothetical protein A2548_00975 [candidate division WOR-1 bacterium RIFOXYD2_FULL_41_8]